MVRKFIEMLSTYLLLIVKEGKSHLSIDSFVSLNMDAEYERLLSDGIRLFKIMTKLLIGIRTKKMRDK